MSYLEDFQCAVERTKKFHLQTPKIKFQPNTLILSPDKINEFSKIVAPLFEKYSHDEFKFYENCFTVSVDLIEIIHDWIHVDPVFTLGWIDNGSANGYFKFDESLISHTLKYGVMNNSIAIHAWLTLPTMEIIDATFLTLFALLNDDDKHIGGCILSHADAVSGLRYKPMLIGTDYIVKSGMMRFCYYYNNPN